MVPSQSESQLSRLCTLWSSAPTLWGLLLIMLICRSALHLCFVCLHTSVVCAERGWVVNSVCALAAHSHHRDYHDDVALGPRQLRDQVGRKSDQAGLYWLSPSPATSAWLVAGRDWSIGSVSLRMKIDLGIRGVPGLPPVDNFLHLRTHRFSKTGGKSRSSNWKYKITRWETKVFLFLDCQGMLGRHELISGRDTVVKSSLPPPTPSIH